MVPEVIPYYILRIFFVFFVFLLLVSNDSCFITLVNVPTCHYIDLYIDLVTQLYVLRCYVSPVCHAESFAYN